MAGKHSIPPVYPAFPDDIDPDAFGHWLSGFTDGEGCFYAGCDGRYRRAFFTLALRLDDRPILELTRSFLACGSFHLREPRKPTHAPALIFAVRDIHSLWNKIVPHFERYPLRAKKANDFLIWKQAVIILHRMSLKPWSKGC